MRPPYVTRKTSDTSTLTCPQNAQEAFPCVPVVEMALPDENRLLVIYRRDFAGRGHGGWRALGEVLGASGGNVYEMAHGHRPMSKRQELRLRMYIETTANNVPNLRIVEVLTCLTCGQLHKLDDCHGQPVSMKVVTPKKPTRPRRDTGCVRYDKSRTSKTREEIQEFIYGH